MGNNLTNQYISASFQGLVQISGSEITDGTGSLIPSLDITASNATTAVSSSHALNADNAVSASYAVASDTAVSASHALIADSALAATSASHAVAADTAISSSHALNADNAISSSYAVTASFALNVSDPTLQDVTDAGAITTDDITTGDILVKTTTNDPNVKLSGSAGNVRTYGVTSSFYEPLTSVDYTIVGADQGNGQIILDADGNEVPGTDGEVRGLEGEVHDALIKFQI